MHISANQKAFISCKAYCITNMRLNQKTIREDIWKISEQNKPTSANKKKIKKNCYIYLTTNFKINLRTKVIGAFLVAQW